MRAYLADEQPAWLPVIARGLADGEQIDRVLARCGTDFDRLEKTWLAWGGKRFAEPQRGAHFEVPAEWRR